MLPIFLHLDEVLELHQELVEVYGGSHGVRDVGLLQSALAVPQSGLGGAYFHSDVFEMASAYLFHIIRNHPFVDGNKRTGSMTAVLFLHANGIELDAPGRLFEAIILDVAEGRAEKAVVTSFFRNHGRRIRSRSRD